VTASVAFCAAMEDLEKTYSRDQQWFSDGLETVATPVALVRSVTSKSQRSQRSSRSRGTHNIPCTIAVQVAKDPIPTVADESSRAAYLKALDKELDDSSDHEKVDPIEKVESKTPSTLTTPSRRASEASTTREHERPPQRRLIRFEDGDPENPNNWTWV
jgi:hypothetical protein